MAKSIKQIFIEATAKFKAILRANKEEDEQTEETEE